jgi:hypothetical protein
MVLLRNLPINGLTEPLIHRQNCLVLLLGFLNGFPEFPLELIVLFLLYFLPVFIVLRKLGILFRKAPILTFAFIVNFLSFFQTFFEF